MIATKQAPVIRQAIIHKSDRLADVLQRYQHLILPLLCLVLWAQLHLSIPRLSMTADEATHLYAGYRYLKCGDVTVSPEHPPIAKAVAAAPLLLMNFAVDCKPFQGGALTQAVVSNNWLFSQNWQDGLTRARGITSIFAVALCVLVWITAKRMLGIPAAIVACSLLTFEPNILAYGSIVMNDVPVTSMMLFAIFSFYLWVKSRTVPYLLLTALVTGLALLTKNSGAIVMPILVLLAITHAIVSSVEDRFGLAVRNLLAVGLICAIAIGIVWLAYWRIAAAHPDLPLMGPLFLPRPYFDGFVTARWLAHQTDTVSFVAGKVYLRAPWFSTLLNFLVRSTAAMVVFTVAGTIGFALSFPQRWNEHLFILIPSVVYLAACMQASRNLSVRYLLPIFPFLLIAIAAGCVELCRRFPGLYYAIPVLVALHATSSVHTFPNYLSFANEFLGGPAQAYKYQPWVDLGQAYPEARKYVRQHSIENCWLIVGWHWDPSLYGVPCHTFSPYLPGRIPTHLQGTVIVSSTLITDVRLPEGEIAAAFKGATPIDRIGGSALLVYNGDFDTSLDTAASELYSAGLYASLGDRLAALDYSKRAVLVAPVSALAHTRLCSLLTDTKLEGASKECTIARNLLLSDPLRDEAGRKEDLDYIESTLNSLAN